MKHLLLELMQKFLSGNITARQFSDAYEHEFNFGINKIPELYLPVYQRVFDAVVFYTEHRDDIADYSGFKTEEQMRGIVSHSYDGLSGLSGDNSSGA